MNDKTTGLSLIASVYHASDSLGLYRAELARILGLMCDDVSSPARLESLLKSGADCRLRAEHFLLFYDSLGHQHAGNAVAMQNWFRRHSRVLGTTPLLALVDENRLEETINVISL